MSSEFALRAKIYSETKVDWTRSVNWTKAKVTRINLLRLDQYKRLLDLSLRSSPPSQLTTTSLKEIVFQTCIYFENRIKYCWFLTLRKLWPFILKCGIQVDYKTLATYRPLGGAGRPELRPYSVLTPSPCLSATQEEGTQSLVKSGVNLPKYYTSLTCLQYLRVWFLFF